MNIRLKLGMRTVLLAVAICALAVWIATWPALQARRLVRILKQAELVGPHEYVAEDALTRFNESIAAPKTDLPPYTHSFSVGLHPRTVTDWLLFRQPMYVEYTAHPIPPAYQGAIKRHRVDYLVGVVSTSEAGRTEEVVWVYIE